MDDRWLSRVLIAVFVAVVALSFMTFIESWLTPCLAHSC
jgi:hypothetical protein